jgi:hypothetical protein
VGAASKGKPIIATDPGSEETEPGRAHTPTSAPVLRTNSRREERVAFLSFKGFSRNADSHLIHETTNGNHKRQARLIK